MPQFLDLPRELRDMVYMALLTMECPKYSLEPTLWENRAWVDNTWQPDTGRRAYATSRQRPPTTCANFLQCNRQIFSELSEVIDFAKKKGLASVKLDCMVMLTGHCYFSWLRIPFVKTTIERPESSSSMGMMNDWASTLLKRYLPWQVREAYKPGTIGNRRTYIHQLWIDVRLSGYNLPYMDTRGIRFTMTWYVCAILDHILEGGPEFSVFARSARIDTVDELVLNVVEPTYLSEEDPYSVFGQAAPRFHARNAANDLVNMWHKIWAAEREGAHYQRLLEKIKRVRVSINDQTWRVRELRLELERGQAERRRIEHRLGFYSV